MDLVQNDGNGSGSGSECPQFFYGSRNQCDIDMLRLKESVNLTCTWECNMENKNLADCLIFRSSEEIADVNAEDFVDLNTTLNFIHPENRDRFTPTILIKVESEEFENVVIKKMVVASEARNLEIFTSHGMYVSTHTGEFVEGMEQDGINIYEVKISPKLPLHDFSIRFASLTNDVNFWLFGVLLVVERGECPTGNGAIDYGNVRKLLNGASLPESGQNCADFLSNFHINGSNNRAGGGMLIGAEARIVSQLKQYVDSKFEELAHILGQREEASNAKLDEILAIVKK